MVRLIMVDDDGEADDDPSDRFLLKICDHELIIGHHSDL